MVDRLTEQQMERLGAEVPDCVDEDLAGVEVDRCTGEQKLDHSPEQVRGDVSSSIHRGKAKRPNLHVVRFCLDDLYQRLTGGVLIHPAPNQQLDQVLLLLLFDVHGPQ